MFSAAIALRYKMPKLERPFAIGKKSNIWMWIVGGVGFCGSLLAFTLSFIMPSMFEGQISSSTWFGVLIAGAIVVVVTPFIIYALRKPSWKDPNADIEPFHWEEQNADVKTAQSATPNTSAK